MDRQGGKLKINYALHAGVYTLTSGVQALLDGKPINLDGEVRQISDQLATGNVLKLRYMLGEEPFKLEEVVSLTLTGFSKALQKARKDCDLDRK